MQVNDQVQQSTPGRSRRSHQCAGDEEVQYVLLDLPVTLPADLIAPGAQLRLTVRLHANEARCARSMRGPRSSSLPAWSTGLC